MDTSNSILQIGKFFHFQLHFPNPNTMVNLSQVDLLMVDFSNSIAIFRKIQPLTTIYLVVWRMWRPQSAKDVHDNSMMNINLH